MLVVQITSGTDYYLCAPPGVIFPSKDQQQSTSNSQPLSNLSPHTTAPLAPHLPDTNPTSTSSREDLLQEFSPNQLQQPQVRPTTIFPQHKMPQELSFKPLGIVGHHPIPQDILEALQPQHNPEVKPNPDPKPYQLQPPYPYSEAMQDLLKSLPPEVIKLIPPEEHSAMQPLYHASAFLLPKPSSNKLSLILNLRAWNTSQDHLPPKFNLPTVYSLRHKLLLAGLEGKTMYFTTWDLKNFYWALKGPIFRFATVDSLQRLQVWQLDAVPFGWDKACFVGQQAHLAAFREVPKPTDTEANVYIDDGLGSGPVKELLNQYTEEVMATLKSKGFPISEKSHPEASESQNYIGKNYQSHRIANTQERGSKLLLLYAITVCAPYLSPKYLERMLGISIYGVSHNSGYSHAAFLRVLVDKHKACTATPFFRNSLAALWAQCMSPWDFSGFFPLRRPESPKVYVDAGPFFIGLVFQLKGVWKSMSVPLGAEQLAISLDRRQQASELYGVLVAVRTCMTYGIIKPTLVLDSTTAFFACIKGSVPTHCWTRTRTLQRISTLVQRKKFLAYLQLVNTRFHPADIPSRSFHNLQDAPRSVQEKLFHIATHPSLLTTHTQPYDPDCSRGAWSTPNWLRWYILKAQHPPTFDLFADHTNALAEDFANLEHPFEPQMLDQHTTFFQPPYEKLQAAWTACQPHLPTSAGMWGLVPYHFYMEVIVKDYHHHICHSRMQVNYQHPTLHGSRALFKSTLFYLPALDQDHQPLPTQCHCHYFNSIPYSQAKFKVPLASSPQHLHSHTF